MNSSLIKLQDNILVEVEIQESTEELVSTHADRVNSSFESIRPILVNISKSIANSWYEINKDMKIDQAEVEINLAFEAEGNIYITKAKTGANLSVKLILKPDEEKYI